MTTNKVFKVLQSLDKTDRKRLMKYMLSPYFNQSKTLTQLCKFFLELIENETQGFEKEATWNLLFPEEAYDDVNFRKYCSDLLGMIEDFLSHQMLDSKISLKKNLLLEALGSKKIEILNGTSVLSTRKTIEQSTQRSSQYYFDTFQIEKSFYQLEGFDLKGHEKSNIEPILYNLDQFYLIEKIKYYCTALSQKNILNYDYKIDFINQIIDYISTIDTEKNPILAVYFQVYLTLIEDQNEGHYFKLKSILLKNVSQFSSREALGVFDSALNYCIRKVNKGKPEFYQEYFELSEEGLKKEILFDNGELAHWRFNNIVANALRIGKVEWSEHFIETYKNYLPASQRDNVVAFGLSRLYRYQKKYDKVLEVLNNVEFEDIGYNLISKATILITYYEMQEIDVLISFLETFRVFLSRHKDILPQRRKNYLNLIKFTKKLTRLIPNDKKAVQRLREEIEQTKDIANIEWLFEKLKALE